MIFHHLYIKTIRCKNYWDNHVNDPLPPIQCCENNWKEKVPAIYDNIAHGGKGEGQCMLN